MQRYQVRSVFEGETLHWFVSHRYSQADTEGEQLWHDIEATSNLDGQDQQNEILARQHRRELRDEQFTEDEAISFQELLLANGYEAHVEPVSQPDITDAEQISFLLAKPDWAIAGHDLCSGYDLPFEVHAWRISEINSDQGRD